MAVTVLVLSIVGTVVALVGARMLSGTAQVNTGDLVYVACQILPYGVVGAVLVARRPDLPFGWLLSLAAMSLVAMLAITGSSLAALEHGYRGQLAVWGLTAGSLMFVPAALEGLVNVRFPSGRPAGRWGVLLDRAIVVGITLALLGGVLGDLTVRAYYPSGPPGGAGRFIDGTPLVGIGNLAALGVPIVILLGVLAGIGVVVRFVRSEGVQRQQLKWRAVGVIVALAAFPLAVTEALPQAFGDVEPLLFVTTLVVPVMRYDLWAIDSIIRRSAAATFASPLTAVENMVRATAEMLRLPYVAVRRGERVLASYGAPTGTVETWPLVHEGESIGELAAAPRHGFDVLADPDRQVLATLAQLVGGSLRAEVLTAELREARQRLVTAREEERRRLRRDLHDGLGPLLTGLGLNLDAIAAQLEPSQERAANYLGHAKRASSQVIGSLRELVEGLRPPALDELGLAGAVRLHVEKLAADRGLLLHLQVPEELELPAAVEVATFRTAVEGVTNVARHSAARRVCVEITEHPDAVTVTVTDDGRGTHPWRPGVGLAGIRERSEELGGTFSAGPTPDGGRLHASYPLEARA